jgi:hypothetical protein
MGRTFTVIGTHALIQVINFETAIECRKCSTQVISHRARCRSPPGSIKSTPGQRRSQTLRPT